MPHCTATPQHHNTTTLPGNNTPCHHITMSPHHHVTTHTHTQTHRHTERESERESVASVNVMETYFTQSSHLFPLTPCQNFFKTHKDLSLDRSNITFNDLSNTFNEFTTFHDFSKYSHELGD